MFNLENESQEELERRQQILLGEDSSEYIAVTRRIENIQRNTNNIQIADLIEQIKLLKDITKKNAEISTENAKSNNLLALIAIFIALATLLTN